MADNYSVIYGWTDKKFFSPIGCDEKPEYSYVKKTIIDKDDSGKKVGEHEEIVLDIVGSSSISEYINSFTDTTDIKKIFARYQMGDVSVLTQRVGAYIDTLGSPDNLLDAQLMIKNGSKLFAELPAEIREKFGNDALKYIEACQDGSIANLLPGVVHEAESKSNSQQAEIDALKAQLADLQNGGIKYE